MPEYAVRLLPLIAALVSLTPASATTYTHAVSPAVAAQPTGANAMPTFGATYDPLTGKFTATPLADAGDDDCGSADCSAAAPSPALASQAAPQPGTQPRKGEPSVTAASASANWYIATLVGETYGYNGNNEAFRLAAETYLPNLPDPWSWAMMFGGMVAIGFLMRKGQTPVTEEMAAATTWDGTSVHIVEMRTPIIIRQARAAAAASTLCCSRQALPGS